MKEQNNIIPYNFDGWFTIFLPEGWMVEQEEDLLNVYSKVNPKGVLQFSLYKKNKDNQCNNDELALQYLNNFIAQFNVIIDENTHMLLETDDFIIATTTGLRENRFLKIWVIVEETRVLLLTYNSLKKTRELSVVDDIVFGIEFDKTIK
jgi:hypothetical protein